MYSPYDFLEFSLLSYIEERELIKARLFFFFICISVVLMWMFFCCFFLFFVVVFFLPDEGYRMI